MFRQSSPAHPWFYRSLNSIPSKAGGNLSASVDAGAITVAGQLVETLLETTADPGAVTIAGQSVAASLGEPITGGAITVAGQSFTDTLGVAIGAGAITIAGQAVTGALGIPAANGAITIAGQTVSADLNGSISVTIDTAGRLAIAGQNFITLLQSPAESNSGGFFFDFDRHSADRRRRRRELEEAEEHEQDIKDEIDRNIARLLHEQQRKDEERKDLERIRSLVIQHKSESPDIDSERVLKALNEARQKQSRANLERLQREMDRMFEEEEDFLALMMLALH